MGCGASAAAQKTVKDVRDVYEIDKKVLNEGKYGSVNRAREKDGKAMRVAKTIDKVAVPQLETIQNEICMMRAMDHPNICRFFEYFEDHRYVFVILELCIGKDIFSHISEFDRFSEKNAAVLMQSMFKALQYMHERQFVHRDLKSENFIFLNNEHNALKLIDFGHARRFEKDEVLTTLCGYPYYVAPQVLVQKYSYLADIWSLGVIMYIMLCGYPPFRGRTDKDTLHRVKMGSFVFDRADWESVSGEAQRLIRDLLAFKQEERCTAGAALQHPWVIARTTATPAVVVQVDSKPYQVREDDDETLSVASRQKLRSFSKEQVEVFSKMRKTRKRPLQLAIPEDSDKLEKFALAKLQDKVDSSMRLART